MKKEIKNLPASIHARLQKQANEAGRPFHELLHYYIIERFLYRVSQSSYCDRLVLKGGLAFSGWGIGLRRPTRDIDFHAYMSNDIEEVKSIVKEISKVPVSEDGIVFDTSALKAKTIMEDAKYEGVRIQLPAYLGRAYAVLQIDISFANVITPKEVVFEYPTLLNTPTIQLYGYNRETAIAEKFQAMVLLGRYNGRMKDFYDLYLLAKDSEFDGNTLVQALAATFHNRNTAIPLETPVALLNDFALLNQEEWSAFIRRTNYQMDEIKDFQEVISFLREFLLLPMQWAAKGESINFSWIPDKGWCPT